MAATLSSSTSSAPLPSQSYAPRKPSGSSSRASSSKTHRIDRTDLTPNNIGQVKRLNSVLLPVAYSERFYKDALKEEVREICQIGEQAGDCTRFPQCASMLTLSHSSPRVYTGLFNDIPVASIVCRYEHHAAGKVKVYLMSLGVLAPYRRLGIASHLLAHLVDVAKPGSKVTLADPDAPKPPPVVHAPGASSADKKKKEAEAAAKIVRKEYEVEAIYLHVQTSNEEARLFYEKNGFKVAEEIKEYYRVGVEPRSAWVLELR